MLFVISLSLVLIVLFSIGFTLIFAPLLLALIPILVIVFLISAITTMFLLLLSFILNYSSTTTNRFNSLVLRPLLTFFADRVPPSIGKIEIDPKTAQRNSDESYQQPMLFFHHVITLSLASLNTLGESVSQLLCSIFELTYLPRFRRQEESDENKETYNGVQIVEMDSLLQDSPSVIHLEHINGS